MRKNLAFILAVLMLLALAACGQTVAPAPSEAPTPAEEPVQAEEPVAAEEPAPAEPEEITVTDMIGREVTVIPGSYQRVVCIGAGALRMYSYIGDVSLLCGVEDIDNNVAHIKKRRGRPSGPNRRGGEDPRLRPGHRYLRV